MTLDALLAAVLFDDHGDVERALTEISYVEGSYSLLKTSLFVLGRSG